MRFNSLRSWPAKLVLLLSVVTLVLGAKSPAIPQAHADEWVEVDYYDTDWAANGWWQCGYDLYYYDAWYDDYELVDWWGDYGSWVEVYYYDEYGVSLGYDSYWW